MNVPHDRRPGEIMTQAESIRHMGVKRGAFRGFMNRKEIVPADYFGPKKSPRFWRADVERLMVERRLVTPQSPLSVDQVECMRPDCVSTRTELRLSRDREETATGERDLARCALNAVLYERGHR